MVLINRKSCCMAAILVLQIRDFLASFSRRMSDPVLLSHFKHSQYVRYQSLIYSIHNNARKTCNIQI